MKIRVFWKRKGSALVVALSVATILFFAEAFLMSQTQNQSEQNKQHGVRMQAWFAARGAMQHAMLKCQLMPTQLYDAAEFSVGKNPLFDFTEYETALPASFEPIHIGSIILKRASSLNPGPRFLTRFSGTLPGTGLKKWTMISQFHPDDLAKTPNVSPWPKDPSGSDVLNPALYIRKYLDDISFQASADPAMQSSPFAFPTGYPYDFKYSVENLEVVSMQGHRKYNEEAIKIDTLGECQFGKNKYLQSNSTVIRLKRN